ncbi:NAD-dependent epimerase, partial [Rhizobium leguminosarum]
QEARTVNGVTRRLADISQAEKLLGFQAEISMEQGLRDLVAWWQLKTAAAGGQAA